MFATLSKRIQSAVDKLRGRGRINEADLKATLREIRMSLLEADVNLEVAKNFIASVQEKALGQAVLESLTPAEQILTVVYEELVQMLGQLVVYGGLAGSGKNHHHG
jgi:signal recognition particle subunit SRP54